MYFIFAFQYANNPSPTIKTEIISKIKSALNTYVTNNKGKIVVPINNNIFIQCNYTEDRKWFSEKIKTISDVRPYLRFYISPIIDIDKGYVGVLNKKHHELISEITSNESEETSIFDAF